MIGQAAALHAHLDVGTVAAILRGDLRAGLRMFAKLAGETQQYEGLLQAQGFDRHVRPQAGHLRFAAGFDVALGRELRFTQLHVRAETAGLDVDRLAGLGVFAQFPIPLFGLGQQFHGALHRQLIRCDLVGHGGTQILIANLHVRAIATDAAEYCLAGLVVTQRNGADSARVDIVGV